ncbi:hypothetical protein PRZ48_000208 [Zasmidium cellare]|uniref:2EXR domain-containing protein n=1 Tax=Zasmidium cellare TaxID=395010 RepID=A0ABR0EXT6_ZASCE|nr:hypothetical protein PRZ48_000208 [Zasmidium cellare]
MTAPHEFTTTPEDSSGSSLFKLPPELRNTIYRIAIGADRTVRLLRKPQKVPSAHGSKPDLLLKSLTTSCALAQVNQQIRAEVLLMALVSASKFKTTVVDFKFGHVLAFFNDLPDRRFKQVFTNKKEGGTPRFVVDLVFSATYNNKDRKDHPGLQAWFTRQRGVNRASQVLFDYAPMKGIEFKMPGGDVREYEKSGSRNVHDFTLLETRIMRQLAKDRDAEEAN